jgi:hypothetical protein
MIWQQIRMKIANFSSVIHLKCWLGFDPLLQILAKFLEIISKYIWFENHFSFGLYYFIQQICSLVAILKTFSNILVCNFGYRKV